MSPTRTPTPPGVDLPSVPETYLKDDLAESLQRYAARLPEAGALLETLRDGAGAPAPPRVGVRGLTGSARGVLPARVHRRTRRALPVVNPHRAGLDETPR